MDNKEFVELAKNRVANYLGNMRYTDMTDDEIKPHLIVTWLVKVASNNKALICTDYKDDPAYIEVTQFDAGKLIIDEYRLVNSDFQDQNEA